MQYFYTIKDLRDALAPTNLVDDVKLSDDDLKRHRVGGRLVTRKEIIRSRKCSCSRFFYLELTDNSTTVVAALGNLFWELEYSDIPAITPELELAKLALVTSKDEEEEEHGRNDIGTDSSASTDATLVDEPVPIGPALAPASSQLSTSPALSPSPSVLGKRQRRARSVPSMDIDSTGDLDRDGFVMVPKLTILSGAASDYRRNSSGTPESKVNGDDTTSASKDVDMSVAEEKENKPPPLPPRRKQQEVNSESVMMFGTYHEFADLITTHCCNRQAA